MSWELYKLDDVCDVINGGSWTQDEYVSQGVKVIKVSNLVNDGVDESNMSYLPYESLSIYEKNILKSYDLVITTVGSHPQLKASAAGRGFVISPVYEGSLLNQNTVCIRTKDENVLFNRYLGYVGRSQDFRHFIQQTGRGAANQMRIPISNIKTYALSLPKLETQKRIATILSNYDDLIENNLKRIKLLEETAQNIYKEWFVNFRFPNYEHTDFNSESGLPLGWEIKNIYDIYIIKYGKNLPTTKITSISNYPVYGASGFIGFYSEKNVSQKVALISSRGSAGKIHRTYEKESFVTNNSFIVTPTNEYSFIPFFYIFESLKLLNLKNYCGGVAIPQLTNSALSNINILVPEKSVIVLFRNNINPIYNQIDLLYTQNQKLKEARDILLPRLMNRTIEL
jgi:type I restriction enzyme S subunit